MFTFTGLTVDEQREGVGDLLVGAVAGLAGVVARVLQLDVGDEQLPARLASASVARVDPGSGHIGLTLGSMARTEIRVHRVQNVISVKFADHLLIQDSSISLFVEF